MYAAVPSNTPTPVIIAGDVIVGDVGRVDTSRSHWFEGLRQSEIQHLHCAIRPQLDVRGLQIAMDDALFVRRFQRFGNLPGDRQCLVERDRPLRDAVGERRAFDQLHHESADAVRPFEAIDLRDVGMIQRGERSSPRARSAPSRSGS